MRIEEWLCRYIEKVDPSFVSLSSEEKHHEDLFKSGRLDSMALMNLLLDAESEFDFTFTPESFQDRRIHTVFGLGKVIGELKRQS